MKITRRVRRAARRLYRACLVGGLLDEGRILRAVRRVAASKRRGSVPLLSHFARLVKLDRTRHEAVVESAMTLPAELQTRVEANIVRAYGPGMRASFATNPALIGGMRIRVGS